MADSDTAGGGPGAAGGPSWREAGLLVAAWGVLAAASLGAAAALSS
jgi:hypothetical protein